LMRAVVPECMRLLKPTGSAVFILQPNSERLGRMRTWLWEFLLWVGKEWGIVQDAYWWNYSALPEAHAIQGRLMRPSLKFCVWLGEPSCYRNQEVVLEPPSPRMLSRIRQSEREDLSGRRICSSGQGTDRASICQSVSDRGGVTPFNVLVRHHGDGRLSAGAHGHSAGTPQAVCEWWTRYLCPPSGTVLDPFVGSGTSGIAALKQDRSFIGIEKVPAYCEIAEKRLAEVASVGPLFQMAEAPGGETWR
jgi:hypothetical protein